VIPPAILKASEGWTVDTLLGGTLGLWISLVREDRTIHIVKDRWRHTTARAYRGNALTSVLRGQRAVAEYLEGGGAQ
jgi:hypothetical protein